MPIGLLLIPLVLTRIPESFGPDAALDIPGLALVTGAAIGIAWGLIRGNALGWNSPEILAALAAGVLLAMAFVAWERRAREPMLPLRFFRSRAFALGNTAGVFLYASLYGALFFLAQFLQTGLGYGPLDAGLRLLPWTAALFVVAPLAGALVNRLGERPLVAGGLALQAVGMGWIGLIAAPNLVYANLVAPLIVAGAGVSMAMPAAQSAVLGAVAKNELGKASGTFNMLRFLGGDIRDRDHCRHVRSERRLRLRADVQRRIRPGNQRCRGPIPARRRLPDWVCRAGAKHFSFTLEQEPERRRAERRQR